MRGILSGKIKVKFSRYEYSFDLNKALKSSEVIYVEVPRFSEFSLKTIAEMYKKDKELIKYVPSLRKKNNFVPKDRERFFNVIILINIFFK